MNLQGIYQASAKGFGFFIPEDGGEDYFVPPRSENGAWNGDTVTVELCDDRLDPARKTASVTAVLTRANQIVTGTVEKRGRDLWLVPGSDRLPNAIKITGKTRAIKNGEKAAVEVLSYGSRKAPPMGALRETFGRAGTRKAAVAAILYNYDITPDFPPDVLAAADAAPQTVEPAATADRLDLRDKLVITIDGASAKDLDDAVSLEKDGAGRLVLGVHIADVSHYVTPGSPLDREAWERGTSVYYADQVVPMLPKALSNGICSLNPQVDRLALSCIMTLDGAGAVIDHTIARTVIRTAQRMTYDDCNALLGHTDPALEQRYAQILPMLEEMGALAARLEKNRRLRGALDLDSRETYVVCDETGAPVDVAVRESGVSEKLIESFMLIANETVARHLVDGGLAGVFRIHEKPSEDKANALRAMLAPLGFDLRQADHFTLQKVLDAARETPQAPAIHTMVLRSLMKARYDGENSGHFGLAAEYYCHFTSPIRRYPDLMVHRILTQSLTGTLDGAAKLATLAQKAAVQSSDREVAAMTAEREIEKCYLAEYMLDKVGGTYRGAVSGVTKFGLFVLLENGVEGLLPVTALPDDRYVHDPVRMTLCGAGSGMVYSFGMPLEVICAATNPGTGQVDLVLPGVPASPSAEARPSTGEKKPGGKRPMHAPRRRKGRR